MVRRPDLRSSTLRRRSNELQSLPLTSGDATAAGGVRAAGIDGLRPKLSRAGRGPRGRGHAPSPVKPTRSLHITGVSLIAMHGGSLTDARATRPLLGLLRSWAGYTRRWFPHHPDRDLSYREKEGQITEGTGQSVMDRADLLSPFAPCSRAPDYRCDGESAALDYDLVTFEAFDVV